MSKKVNAVMVIAGTLLLSACGASFDYEALRHTDMTGRGFNAELARL